MSNEQQGTHTKEVVEQATRMGKVTIPIEMHCELVRQFGPTYSLTDVVSYLLISIRRLNGLI